MINMPHTYTLITKVTSSIITIKFTETLIKEIINTRTLNKITYLSVVTSIMFEDLLVPQNAPPGLGQPLRAPDGSLPGLLPDMCSEVVILLACTATKLPPTPVT